MRAPEFWWRKPGLSSRLAAPIALLYGSIAARRLAGAGAQVGLPVICVGNPTLGGAGKTPLAITLARMLSEAGHRPALLTRGYGGRLRGPVQVDPARHRAAEVGDEPLLLARVAPTIVARDRLAGAWAAKAEGASIIVMDDGFQNPSLAKDLAVLVVDSRRGLGNGQVFPAGPLRAPLMAQLERADALVVVGEDAAAAPLVQTVPPGVPVWRARVEADPASLAALAGRKLLAFAGIADPEKFFATLRASGLDVQSRHGFPDHHRFSQAQAATLLAEADRGGLVIVTTEKDAVRFDGDGAIAALKQRALTLPITLTFADAQAVRERLLLCCAGAA